MVVTIDGPAGAGKSSVSKALAARLGFRFLDTGAMYRAVALAGLREGWDWSDTRLVGRLASKLQIQLSDNQTWLNGEEVTSAIRSGRVTEAIHHAADNVHVRAHLSVLQRKAAANLDVVTEGRDQGSVVFRDAECKIFLTASAEERARRRQAEMAKRGERLALQEVLARQNERDRRDRERPVGRLVKAEDAIEVCTDGLTADEVLEKLVALVKAARPE